MKKTEMFKGKNILVLGLALTGYHVAQLLHELGAIVVVNDGKTPEDLTHIKALEALGITVVTGSHPLELIHDKVDYMVKNPGIPYTNELVKLAQEKNIPILTDVEIAYQVAQAPIISITGTNGKTTTTTLIADMLAAHPHYKTVEIAGNIGVPSTQVAKRVCDEDVIVMEMSSFQLMGVQAFRPHIAVITNIYEAHLDYHGSRQGYVDAKLNMIRQQEQTDYLILNGDLQESKAFAKESRATVYYFSKHDTSAQAYVKDGMIYALNKAICSVDTIQVPGVHNLENVLAATLVAVLTGQTIEQIVTAIQNFTGVKHRTQYVTSIEGRLFYNDSKATNILATKMALNGFSKPVILIAGGLDRGNGFEELEPSLAMVKTLVVYGETKYKLEQSAKHAQVDTVVVVETLEQAVEQAYALSREKDVILFSPACASWDQFKNFEVRGDAFISAVEQLKK